MVDSALTKNIQEQLDRLLSQLSDLEEVKGDSSISPEEYEDLKKDTEDQISEFEGFLKRLMKQASDQKAAKEAQDVINLFNLCVILFRKLMLLKRKFLVLQLPEKFLKKVRLQELDKNWQSCTQTLLIFTRYLKKTSNIKRLLCFFNLKN